MGPLELEHGFVRQPVWVLPTKLGSSALNW